MTLVINKDRDPNQGYFQSLNISTLYNNDLLINDLGKDRGSIRWIKFLYRDKEPPPLPLLSFFLSPSLHTQTPNLHPPPLPPVKGFLFFFFLLLFFFAPPPFFFFFFCLFRATPVTYGGSQARSRIGAVAAGSTSHAQQHRIPATFATYTTAHPHARSLTHWARQGVEPASSWMLVSFVNCWATTGTP